MPPQETMKENNNSNLAVIVSASIVIIVIAFFFITKDKENKPSDIQEAVQNITKEPVSLNVVDLNSAKSNSEKLPKGFPASIPLEMEDITLSDSKIYTDRAVPVTVYTVNYFSEKTVEQKYAEYLNMMNKNGFIFGENGKDNKNHVLNGTKDNDTLLIVVANFQGKTQVQLSYTEVK